MAEEPLYQDDKFKIEIHPDSVEDHILNVKDGNDELTHLIGRGILKELAHTPRGGIESKLYNSNPTLLLQMRDMNIGIDGLHVAICQAYIEDEERVRRYMDMHDVKETI